MSTKQPTEGLITQSEARAEAKRLNVDRKPGDPIAIAVAYPKSSWGGREEGWTVNYVMPPKGERA